jgi:hypothetical protein
MPPSLPKLILISLERASLLAFSLRGEMEKWVIPASFWNARSEVRRTRAVGFGVHHACSENAVVAIWLPIGADVILERSTCEWEDKITALAPRTVRRKDTSLKAGRL